MDIRLVNGSKNGKVLCVDGYRYERHKDSLVGRHWRCWRKGCRAKVKTNLFGMGGNIHLLTAPQEHNHADDTAITDAIEFRHSIQEEAARDPTKPPRRIYNAHVAQTHRAQLAQGGGDRSQLPKYESIKASIHRTRSANIPAIPRNVNQVVINGPWAETWLQEKFLQNVDHFWGISIFATDENLRKLQECGTVYMDGTFKVCPRPYQQVFEVFGDFQGHVVPLVHVLMENRTTGDYRQVLGFLKRAVRRVSHHRWRPQTVVCDYEQALHAAIETELPTSQISGCYFHFNQALWRKIQELRLAGDYRQSWRLRGHVRKVMALGYLPLQLMRINFANLMAAGRTTRLINRYVVCIYFPLSVRFL